MKIKKKLFALVMAIAMVLTYMPAIAFAEGEEGGVSAVGDSYSIIAPVSAEPMKDTDGNISGYALGDIGTDNVKYTGPYGFTVEYANGDKINYIYNKITTAVDGSDEMTYEGFLREGAEDYTADENWLIAWPDDENGSPVFTKGWNRDVKMILNAPCWEENDSTHEVSYFGGFNIGTTMDVWGNYVSPVSVEFEPAEGFEAEGYIGYNYIDESYFYGEGNAFVVKYDYLRWDPETQSEVSDVAFATYRYMKTADGEEGFYEDANVNNERFSLSEDDIEVFLKKGSNAVTIPCYAFATASEEPTELEVNVNIKASKLNAYANWPLVEYTGKTISKSAIAKKLVVKDSNDKKIPASAYTFTYKKTRKMGWYEINIKFRDKTKYVDSIYAEYGVGPKTPAVNKIRGGKKRLTVTWKKFTKAQLKSIDGLYIEVAQNKNFTKGYKVFKVSKKAVKKNYKVLKKLTGGKKYYVRISSYKKIKQNGESYYMFSADSKAKAGKTKK